MIVLKMVFNFGMCKFLWNIIGCCALEITGQSLQGQGPPSLAPLHSLFGFCDTLLLAVCRDSATSSAPFLLPWRCKTGPRERVSASWFLPGCAQTGLLCSSRISASMPVLDQLALRSIWQLSSCGHLWRRSRSVEFPNSY